MNRPDKPIVDYINEDEYVRLDEHNELEKYCNDLEKENGILKESVKSFLDNVEFITS